jgi:hypothetical protein
MPEEPPAPTDEQNALGHIAALIKTYEPQFDLQRSFTPGVLGCSDPQYPAIKNKWLDDLDRKGITNTNAWVAKGILKETIDYARDDLELSWQTIQPADSRFNWRVTVHHGDYFIHIMAVDKKFERFAFSLQRESALKEGLTSDKPRPSNSQYKVVNHLSELKPVLDDIYDSFKRQEEERRVQDRIDRAVANEREKWVKRLDDERTRRLTWVYLAAFAAIVALAYAAFRVMSLETALTLIFISIFIGVAIYEFRKQTRESREINRAVEERNQQKAAAEERLRIYKENYYREGKALRERVLDDLRAIARGEKRRLDPEAVEAAKKIMERQGVNNPGMAENHPEIVEQWTTLINDLSAETLEDAKAIQNRFADLLLPETLKELEALNTLKELVRS